MCLTNPSLHPVGYNLGWRLLFYIWYKTVKWLLLVPASKNATKILSVCVWVCVCVKSFTYAESKLYYRYEIPFPVILNSNMYNESFHMH